MTTQIELACHMLLEEARKAFDGKHQTYTSFRQATITKIESFAPGGRHEAASHFQAAKKKLALTRPAAIACVDSLARK